MGGSRAQQRVNIPGAGGGANQIQAGLVHADGVDLQAPSPQREKPNRSRDRAGVEHRLGAVTRVILDGEVGEHKARPGQQTNLNRGETNRAAQRGGDQLGDLRLVSAHAHQRGHDQPGQQNDRKGHQQQPKALAFSLPAFALFVHGLV